MTWRRLDQLTGHKPGKWTWDIDAIYAIDHTLKNADIISIDPFDHKRFAERGVAHLEDIWTVSVFREQKEHADLRGIQKKTHRLLARKSRRYQFFHRQPRLQDVARLFSQGYMIIATLDMTELGDRGGIDYHAVVISKVTRSNITVQDPGLPPRSSRNINLKTFLRAIQTGSIIAVRVQKRPKQII